jgi:basic membrane lipoprotein Med (substrate-binding protein (PBP1-ABC) superfamily)
MKNSITAVALIVMLVIGIVAGYGVSSMMAPPTAPSAVTTTLTVSGVATAVTTTVTPQMASAIGQLKVGLILPITPEDYSWNYQADYSARLLQKQFGFQLTEAENLFDGTSAEPVATDWASKGYNVIIGQGLQYQDMFNKIAPQFPKTVFVCVDCFAGTGNVYNVWWYMADAAYLIGMLAGNMTKTNKIGMIGGGRAESIWAGHEAFKRGVLAVNKQATFLESWMAFSWADVAGAKKAGEQMADQGADFIFSSGDGIDVGVRQVAKEKNIQCSDVYADAAHLDPDHIAASIVVRWDIAYLTAMSDYVRGDYNNKWLQADVFSGMVSLGAFGNAVPQSMQQWILQQQTNLRQGVSLPFTLDPSCFDHPDQPQCKP